MKHSNGTFCDTYERWSTAKEPKHMIPLYPLDDMLDAELYWVDGRLVPISPLKYS
jgi:hypothetical protein